MHTFSVWSTASASVLQRIVHYLHTNKYSKLRDVGTSNSNKFQQGPGSTRLGRLVRAWRQS